MNDATKTEAPAVGSPVDRGVGRLEPERAAPTPCVCPTRDALDAMLRDGFKRRAEVEQVLMDMAAGKAPMPDAAKLRELARRLGDPTTQPLARPIDRSAERPCCGTLPGSRHRSTCARGKTPNARLSG